MEANVLQSFHAVTPTGKVPIEKGQVLIGAFDGDIFFFPLTVQGKEEWAVEVSTSGRAEYAAENQTN